MKKLVVFIGFLAVLALCFPVGSYAALSWVDEPFMGLNVRNGGAQIDVNGVTETIPLNNTSASQSYFLAPIPVDPVWGYGYIWADSSVLMTPGSAYNVDRTVTYLDGSFVINFVPTLVWMGGDYIAITGSGFGDTGDLAACGGTWDACLGHYSYTETWTGTQGPDLGNSITFTRNFTVGVPEPATMLLLGLGLVGLAGIRRKFKG